MQLDLDEDTREINARFEVCRLACCPRRDECGQTEGHIAPAAFPDLEVELESILPPPASSA